MNSAGRVSLARMPPTLKQITETGTRFYRIVRGKIAEMWGDENVLGLLQQLGAVPQFG